MVKRGATSAAKNDSRKKTPKKTEKTSKTLATCIMFAPEVGQKTFQLRY